MRTMCYRCCKLVSMCLCSRIPQVENRTEIVILQHAHERMHALGTARFARLGLRKARVEVLHHSLRDGFRREFVLPEGAALLFPQAGAPRLDHLAPDERPKSLVLLDGTWGQARRLYRENEWLHALPHVVLAPRAESNYRIRKEPRPEYVSTIEAILEALRILEGEQPQHAELLAAFDAMIDEQIAKTASVPRAPRTRRRGRRRTHAVPRDCIEAPHRVVTLYCEVVQRKLRAHPKRPELLQLTARRPASGDSCSFLLKQTRPPCGEHLARLGVDEAELARGLSPEDARARLRAFWHPGDIIITWNSHIVPAITESLGASCVPTRRLHAKSICSALAGASPGSLDECLRKLGLATPDHARRAEQRLAALTTLWRTLSASPWQTVARALRGEAFEAEAG